MQRKMLLEAKQQVIGEMIEAAKDSLYQMPDTDYFEVIYKVVEKNALNKAGEIVFSKRDLERVPASYNFV